MSIDPANQKGICHCEESDDAAIVIGWNYMTVQSRVSSSDRGLPTITVSWIENLSRMATIATSSDSSQ